MNVAARRVQAATRLQAAYRGKKARREEMRVGHHAQGSGELRVRLEPTVAIVISLTFAMQWDQAVVYHIGDVSNSAGLVAVNGALTMLYAAMLTFILMYVHEGYSRRLLSLFKLCLQTLVGWMWRSCIELADLNFGRYYMAGMGYSLANAMWARFGVALAFALVFPPFITLLTTVVLHPTRASPADSLAKHYSMLVLGASAIVSGFAWHRVVANFSLALVEEALKLETDRLNLPRYALAAALVRSVFVSFGAGFLKASGPFLHASKVAKPPKKLDTLRQSFRDRSTYLGAASLLWTVVFTWRSAIDATAVVAALDGLANSGTMYGGYLVYTVLAVVLAIAALLLAARGSAVPKCLGFNRGLGQMELLLFGSVPILLGICVQSSYASLVTLLASVELAGAVYWALGAIFITTVAVAIVISALFSYRSGKQQAGAEAARVAAMAV